MLVDRTYARDNALALLQFSYSFSVLASCEPITFFEADVIYTFIVSP